ncbi:MAG: imidazole glycerol phosphate synthase subunit HisF [Candidatus Lokiarchaeota archaeon]|nr:imidazole glycerol phosphate synthase subunit HisF [Candidatus Lokiarchaeota archaeon]
MSKSQKSEVKKIVPCLDVKDGRVVKGIKFVNLRDAGDPVEFAQFYENEGADELVFLDITATVEKRKTVKDLVQRVADAISIPFCVGGGIASMDDVAAVLDSGADKVSLNTAAVKNPNLLEQISEKYGSEHLVCAIDARRVYVPVKKAEASGRKFFFENENSNEAFMYDVLTHGGTKSAGLDAIDWAVKVKELGVGEILPTSKDKDGTKDGYDLKLTSAIAYETKLPVTASGGAGTIEHIYEALTKGKATSALAASIFHFREVSIKEVKKYCSDKGLNMILQ